MGKLMMAGRIEEAIPLAKKLVAERSQDLGENHPETIFAYQIVGGLYRKAGDHENARNYFQQSVRLYRDHGESAKAELAQALLNTGQMAHAQGDRGAALSAYLEGYTLYRTIGSISSAEVVAARRTLEHFYFEDGDWTHLAPLFEESLQASRAQFGNRSEEVRQDLLRSSHARRRLREYARATAFLNEACRIADALYGQDSAQFAACLLDRGRVAFESGQPGAAVNEFEQACSRLQRLSDGSGHADCENLLGQAYVELGRLEEAIRLFEHAAAFHDASGDHAAASANLLNLSAVHEDRGEYDKAISATGAAFKHLQALGKDADPLAVTQALDSRAALHHRLGQLAEAQADYEESLAIRERGGETTDLVGGLNSLATVLDDRGLFEQAQQLLERAHRLLQESDQLLSRDGPMVLGNLASVLQSRGQYQKAKELYTQALQISEKVHPQGDPTRAYAWNNLGDILKELGEYSSAGLHYRTALQIWTTAFGENHRLVATAHNNLGTLAQAMGDYQAAERHLHAAVEITGRVLPEGHPEWATAINNLAKILSDSGDYDRAETLYLASFHAFRKKFGDDHPMVGLAYNNLGTLYATRGDYARAARFLRSAADLARKRNDSRALGLSLFGLASIFDKAELYVDARKTYDEALAVLEVAWGPDHLEVALVRQGLASLLAAQGQYAEAERVLERALAVVSRVEGRSTPTYARYEGSLAYVLAEQGRYQDAERLFLHASNVIETTFGADHPDLATLRANHAITQWSAGQQEHAIRTMQASMDIRERGLASILTTGSEEERQLFLATSQEDVHWGVSMHAHGFPEDPEAEKLAMLVVLRRKGRVLEVTADTTRVLQANLDATGRALLAELREQRAQIARLSLASQGAITGDRESLLAELRRSAATTEAKLARHSNAFRERVTPVSIERVAQAIPAGTALVEIVRYLPFDPREHGAKSWKPERYGAYVLRRNGHPKYVDLGSADTVDRLVSDFRRALESPRTKYRTAAQRLHAQIVVPIQSHLEAGDDLLIAPDGALNLVPFAALVDSNGRPLIETTSVTYLTTGRELLRSSTTESRAPAQIFADPSFGNRRSGAGRQPRTLLSDLGIAFTPLKGAAREGRALKALMPEAQLATGEDASEAHLKSLHGPDILHLATHAYFLDDLATRAGARGVLAVPVVNKVRPKPKQSRRSVRGPQNPLLRAGLALAGANAGDDQQDGLLTALEAASLDLWGTELVVLSACDTGVGEVRVGEGVYGLRRAFSLAGAESLVMSLWEVADGATASLMTGFYRRLAAGDARNSALRSTQLELLQQPKYNHPYYWASFVQYGRSGPLSSATASQTADEK